MKALDFEYDGLNLSNFGCIICTFDSAGQNSVSMGAVITFDKTYIRGSKKFLQNGISYESCLEAEFYICKNPCHITDDKEMYFSIDEQRELMRWLNRGEYLKFKPLDDEYGNIYYEGSFYNIEKVEFSGEVIGLHLYLTTNSPFAFSEAETYCFNILSADGSYVILDSSDDIGYTYADIAITCKKAGTMRITNSIDNRTTEIKNCSNGETITMKNMIIESSSNVHQATIMNDFNFQFVKIANSYSNRVNRLTFSLPCSVILKYTPTMKVGI